MWRLKQFMPRDQAGLEGKSIEVGAYKLQLRSTIAQGGFSSVYLARDGATGRHYAVKHIICNDAESVELVKKEVATMKALRGHPNIITLYAQVMYDMGRTKECFLVMEFCEKMLVNILENRGAGYFDEKQILLIFRDICNAVYAMHCQTPPIAHRDLKAENLLLGGDGSWKLCDFGSTSTNHKRFEKPDEMGLEEDAIRKYTKPAYRPPEMWDLYRRELVSEKVDMWALGCILYRIAYLKSAFDGESKLQVLNGNYRIPDAPRYSTAVTDLIRELLVASPERRPDVIQIWRRVNNALPSDLRKHHPDKPAAPAAPTSRAGSSLLEARSHGQVKEPVVPSRSPPLPPANKENERKSSQNGAGAIGAFWSTPYAQDATQDLSKADLESPGADNTQKTGPVSPGARLRREEGTTPDRSPTTSSAFQKKRASVSSLIKKVQGTVHTAGGWGRDEQEHIGYEMRHDIDDEKEAEEGESKGYGHLSTPSRVSNSKTGPSSDQAFNDFAAQFDAATFSNEITGGTAGKEQDLQSELQRVSNELQQALADKAALASKNERLSAICRSQQQEIQSLKVAFGQSNISSPGTQGQPSPRTAVQSQAQQSSTKSWQAFDQGKEKPSGSIWDLQEGLSPIGSTSQRITVQEGSTWQPFGSGPTRPLGPVPDGRRRSLQHSRAASLGGDGWAFSSHDTFSSNVGGASSKSASGQTSATSNFANLSSYGGKALGNKPPDSSKARGSVMSQPAGWAGF